MRIAVQKYGGSSVATVEKIHQVARRVVDTAARGYSVVVVVSAMGNTTNELLALARRVSPAPGRRELDMLISVGERIAMALLAMAINDLGAAAVSFTGSQSDIITDESHAAARVVAVRPFRIRAALEAGEIAIVAGFQGVSRDKEVTTLGRGGSDTTAVALAAALGAEHCEICSDVDGLYSADPRSVPQAIRLDEMSLAEALALARSGAQVLHDEAVAYAAREGIALWLSKTTEATPGTRIEVPPRPPRVTAVVADDKLERFVSDDLPALLGALAEAGASIRSADDRGAVVDLRNWPDREAFTLPPGARTEGRVAGLTVGGPGADPALLTAGLAALTEAGISVLGWSAHPEAITWRVPIASADEGARALHAALIEAADQA